MPLAPIVIFCYNRPEHLRKSLLSLKAAVLSDESELFVFIDGPKEDASPETRMKIEEVKKVAHEMKWCNNVTYRESAANKGLAQSVMEGVGEIVNAYGKVIVLEDDHVCDKYFLQFMNDALNVYENEEQVVCVSGYIYPVQKKLPETFLIKGADCWGWGTWKRGWACMETDAKKLLAELENKKLTNDFDFGGTYPYTQMLRNKIEGKNNSWAILWYASAYLKNKLVLYPGASLIQNIGNDGTGEHSWQTDSFKVILRNQPVNVDRLPAVENADAKKKMAEYFDSNKPVQPEEARGFLPVLRSVLSKFTKRSEPLPEKKDGWFGDFKSWNEVKVLCTGYDEGVIFEKVKNATLEVKKGNAVFERDSVLFYKEEYKEEFVKAMDTIAISNGNKLNVLDFGGALGSVYFQYKKRFDKYDPLNWSIVEQKHFVDFGKKELEDKCLRFFYTVEDAVKEQRPHVVLLSSVISYMEDPYGLLKKILDLKAAYIIVDRTIFTDHKNDILTRQVVPESIYKASYPCWVLNKNKLITFMLKDHDLVMEFDPYNNEQVKIDDKEAYFRALVFKRK